MFHARRKPLIYHQPTRENMTKKSERQTRMSINDDVRTTKFETRVRPNSLLSDFFILI